MSFNQLIFQKNELSERQRKATYGPFETSFEEDEEKPETEPMRSIQWDPFMEPFTNNPVDYYGIKDRDQIPTMNLSRNLRKGDILDLQVGFDVF